MMIRLNWHWQEIGEWEAPLTARFNRAGRFRSVLGGFRLVSRLGDGVFWYALMLTLLAAYGLAALPAVLNMVLAGLAATLIYKWLKKTTLRPRPCHQFGQIVCLTAPLDRFSFPSGHTLHAVAFSLVVIQYYPVLAWLVLPFSALVAVSRLVLGLHYPTDVLAGIALGGMVALVSMVVV
ncbi:MAG: phosphatase PAP2 family protein [Pseudomonadota bacterium]